MVCYCMANKRHVKYVSNSETSDKHFILLDVHEIEKRQATPTQISSLPVETTPITQTFTSHKYYTKTIIQNGGNGYWDEMYNHTKHVYLSNNTHLDSSGIDITFTMPFYGHNVNRLQLTTSGFIYMGPLLHPFLTHSQYVAPLMANFDTKAINSKILYKEYKNRFIVVEWRNVQLNDENHHGQFTFQSKLFQNGTIMFIYKKVPVAIGNISTSNHSVKLGVSDAFYYDFVMNGTQYKLISKYHSVNIDLTKIKANTVVILDPLPTCNTLTGCNQCVSANIDFDCSWCSKISRCSDDGLDWNLQKWYQSRCHKTAGNTSSICMLPTTAKPTTARPTTARPTTARPKTVRPTTTTSTVRPTTTTSTSTGKSSPTGVPTATQKTSQIAKGEKQTGEKDDSNMAVIVVPIALILVIVGLVGGWIYYAYTRPNTASGRWLIEHFQTTPQSKTSLSVKFKRSDGCKLENEDIVIDS